MGIVVQKYGGSSLSGLERLQAVADSVVSRRRAGDSVVVVVSAMGKTTDELIERARAVASQPPQREMDMLVTAGERISMALLSMCIHEAGQTAISFTGSQSGIITESTHQGARILEVRPYRIETELALGKVVIVAGYQGVSLDREITTLGRGGSDTSAVALAASLGADACEIYSDVDGVYSADPRVCAQAKLLPSLDYVTMQTMSGAGAKVLNAQAVEFARQAGIVIKARKTGDTSGRETVVRESTTKTRSGVVAVVGAKHVSHVAGQLPPSDIEMVTGKFRACGARVMHMTYQSGRAEWVLQREDIPGRAHEPLLEIAQAFRLDSVAMPLVTVIGDDLTRRLALIHEVLGRAGIEMRVVAGSGERLMLLVEPDDVDTAVLELHEGLEVAAS